MNLRREFSSREDLQTYLAALFPEAAAAGAPLSPIPGGRAAAEARLAKFNPFRYAGTRNFLSGSISRLSPYIRHGVITLAEVREMTLTKAKTTAVQLTKFIQELAWRDYWQRVYAKLGDGVWKDQESYKTGHSAAAYAAELPGELERGETGLACMDSFVRELKETGYLHNHARMWFAAYVVHYRKVQWQAGARLFLTHLLDGDPASNNLSWQWVASTFASKPYIFNRENLERYTEGRYCNSCARRNDCPFDQDYDTLARELFR